MAKSPAFARIKADILAMVAGIPPGRVTTAADLGRQIDVPARHVAYILATLDEFERAATPWWRVVADGGAVGRHKRCDDQMAALRRDGVAVSAAGIVTDFFQYRVAVFPSPPSGMTRRPAGSAMAVDAGNGSVRVGAIPRRARGSKGSPSSSV